jgi:hypothetical protein
MAAVWTGSHLALHAKSCHRPCCVLVQRLHLSWALCRRQEIVFIGAGMSEEDISKQLDTALLKPAEMSKYIENYKHMPDPPHPELTQTPKA